MMLAQDRLAAIAAWIDASSGPRRTPLDGDTLIGPWAVIVAIDLSEPPTPEFDIDALPPCAIVGLDSPAEPILAAVERAGAGAIDLATFPLLCAPLWALSPAHRAEIAPKLPMLR